MGEVGCMCLLIHCTGKDVASLLCISLMLHNWIESWGHIRQIKNEGHPPKVLVQKYLIMKDKGGWRRYSRWGDTMQHRVEGFILLQRTVWDIWWSLNNISRIDSMLFHRSLPNFYDCSYAREYYVFRKYTVKYLKVKEHHVLTKICEKHSKSKEHGKYTIKKNLAKFKIHENLQGKQ